MPSESNIGIPCLENEPDTLGCLFEIVKRLRGNNGCPWDKKQTPESLTKYLREETDELIEAIVSDDSNHICEELGDIFFILTLLSTIYAEQDRFTISNSLRAINEKMIRRHPHVFAGKKITSDEELRAQWLAIKDKENKSAL